MKAIEEGGVKRPILVQLFITWLFIVLMLFRDNWIFKELEIIDVEMTGSIGSVYLQRVEYRFTDKGLLDIYVYERKEDVISICTIAGFTDVRSYCIMRGVKEDAKCLIHVYDQLIPKLLGINACL